MTALYVVAVWLTFGIVGNGVLYIGYGFYCASKEARDCKDVQYQSQRVVVLVDTVIVVGFTCLDASLNMFWYSVWTLDAWPSNMIVRTSIRRGRFAGRVIYLPNLVTGRMNNYMLNVNERRFRRSMAEFLEAWLGPKDPRKFHIKNVTRKFSCLD